MRPFCRQAFPNRVAFSVVLQACGSAGAFQRKLPTGGAANGMPFQEYVSLATVELPSTRP